MAELALGIVSLAGLFNNAVDSYGYVRLGQQYARDFETSQTKLDLSRLQLSRWGAALGLDAYPTKARGLPALSVHQHEVQQAEDALRQITDLLDDASIASKRFEVRNKHATALDPDDLALHKKISSLVSRRLPKTAIVKKTTWALYGENDLNRLVDDITELTSQLVLLFPARASVQKELCAEEVQEIDDGSLSIIADVAAEQDPLVAEAARSLIQTREHAYTAAHTRTVQFWDTGSDVTLHTLEGHSWVVSAVTFSPDGRWLASCSWDKTVRLWDADTGAALHMLKGHSEWVKAVTFSPDGRRLASCSGDKTVRLWDANTGAALHMLEGHSDWVFAVKFSPDGRRLASCSEDKTVRLWDADTGAALHTLEGHSKRVNAVKFSPDGRRLASCSYDKTIRLWDADTGGALQMLEGQSGWVYAVTFSPDGRQLASRSADYTVRLWSANAGVTKENDNVFQLARGMTMSRKTLTPLNASAMVGDSPAFADRPSPQHSLHQLPLVAQQSWNFDSILKTGSLSDLNDILQNQFQDVASGEWSWLTELADLGYDRKEIAGFIAEQRLQFPWVSFKACVSTSIMPDPVLHIHRCAHGSLKGALNTYPGSHAYQAGNVSSSTWDLRRVIVSLCGLGGIVPDSPERRDWNGDVKFSDNRKATISYSYGGFSPSEELSRVTRAVAGVCTAIAMTQEAQGCCNTFTILCRSSGESFVELCTVAVGDILYFYKTLQAASAAQGQSLQSCKGAALTILSCLRFSGLSTSVENVSDDVQNCLHVSALAAQTLCLSFAMYSQAHCSPFAPFFLQKNLEQFDLLGILRDASEGKYIRAETKQLTCLDAMLKAPVVIFSVSIDAFIAQDRLDVLACAADVVDTWGPGIVFRRTANKQEEAITSIDLRGGKIYALEGNGMHWTYRDDLHDDWWASDWNPPDKYLIGAIIECNLSCQITERKCVETVQGFWLPLGTQSNYWDQRHREAALQAGQYVTPLLTIGWDKVPGVSLKAKFLEDFQHRHEQIAFLNAPCGLQVSFCSGLAKRVNMKDVLAELLPFYVKRSPSEPHNWKTLTDVYQIIETLRGKDMAKCQAMFQCMSAMHHDCFKWFWNQVLEITKFLKDTGMNQTGDRFMVGLISSDASEPMRRVPFLAKAGNFWLNALQDTESCATFAFFTLNCLQLGGQGCRHTEKGWHGQVVLSQTEVHQQSSGDLTRFAANSMALQDGQLYPLGGRDEGRSVRLCVRVIRPSPSVDPQLLVQKSMITPGIWKRILMRRHHFLLERLSPNDVASRVFMTGSHTTALF